MPDIPENDDGGQASPCDCIGCRVFKAIWPNGEDQVLSAEETAAALSVLAQCAAQLSVDGYDLKTAIAISRDFMQSYAFNMKDQISQDGDKPAVGLH